MNRKKTDLRDIHGNIILDGDIILIGNTSLYVHFENNGWVAHTKYKELKHCLDYDDNGKFEAIGNIYDNPELLEN